MNIMWDNRPLAYYLRPTTLDEVVWQEQTKLSRKLTGSFYDFLVISMMLKNYNC